LLTQAPVPSTSNATRIDVAVVPETEVSVLIPIFDERDNLRELWSRLERALDGRAYEIVFVDDGSTDGSFEVLAQLHRENPRIKVIRMMKNFGQTHAFGVGLGFCAGSAIVTMDGDLQNFPEDIPMLLDKLREGYDVATGWRHARADPLVSRRIPSIVANRLIAIATGVPIHDSGCFLKAYRSDVAHNLDLHTDMHRFTPALAASQGARIAEVPIRHVERKHGTSKYGIGRTLAVLVDLITLVFQTRCAARPMRLFGLLGLLAIVAGLGVGIVSPWPGVFVALFGAQLVSMGLLFEMVVRGNRASALRSGETVRETLIAHRPPASARGSTT
jgi:hypothetical protein